MTKRKMFGISKDLNEGMSQTITAAKNNAGQLRYEVIPLAKIKLDPNNPRKLAIKPEDLKADTVLSTQDSLFERKKRELEAIRSLSNSIRKQGVRNAVEVYKDGVDYRLISGERRVLASLLAGKEDIPARIVDSRPSEFDIRYLQWIENIEREDLSIWERLQNVQQLINAYTNHEQTTMSATLLKDIIGCSLPHAMTYLAVLQAPSDIQALLQENHITNLEKAALLAKINNSALRASLVKSCIEDNLPLSALKKLATVQNRSIPTVPSVKKQGRTAKRVTLGHTPSIIVVKQLITAALSMPTLTKHKDTLMAIDWNNYAQVSKSFQTLIKIMETER